MAWVWVLLQRVWRGCGRRRGRRPAVGWLLTFLALAPAVPAAGPRPDVLGPRVATSSLSRTRIAGPPTCHSGRGRGTVVGGRHGRVWDLFRPDAVCDKTIKSAVAFRSLPSCAMTVARPDPVTSSKVGCSRALLRRDGSPTSLPTGGFGEPPGQRLCVAPDTD